MKRVMKPSYSEECVERDINRINEYRIENAVFRNDELKQDYIQKEFFECELHHISIHTNMRNSEFVDVIFDHCDFSNGNFEECVFQRCEFKACRMTGIDFSLSTFTDVSLNGCQCMLSNMNATKWKQVEWLDTNFTDASFYSVKLKEVDVHTCLFNHCEIHETPLAGINLSDSDIDGIAVLAENLKGVKVNSEQAIVLAQLLGIVVV